MANRRSTMAISACIRRHCMALCTIFVVGSSVVSTDVGISTSKSLSGFACAFAHRNTPTATSPPRNQRYDTSLQQQSRLNASYQASDLFISQRPLHRKGHFWNALRGLATLPASDPNRHSNPALLSSTATLSPSTILETDTSTIMNRGGGVGVLLKEDQKENAQQRSGNLEGRALLLLAALCLGTLNTTIRMVYAIPVNGNPINPWLMSVIRSWMATICFAPLWWMSTRKERLEQAPNSKKIVPDETASFSSPSQPIWKAALELTVWNFGARALWNIGLVTTPSARASFLIQLSVVMTPLISLLAGKAVPSTILLASMLALSGLSLVSGLSVSVWNSLVGNKLATAAAAASSFGSGDILILMGTLCWSLYMFRLSLIGNRYEGIKLQGLKTIILSALYSGWYGGTLLFGNAVKSTATTAAAAAATTATTAASTGILSAISAISPMIWILLFYTALGPGTIAAIAQHKGQTKVSTASEANVILSMESVFAALTGLFVLGEVPTRPEAAGGGLILLAAIVATR